MKRCLSMAAAVAVSTAGLASLSPLAAHADNAMFNNPNNRIYWGVRLQGAINIPSNISFPNSQVIKLYGGKGGIAAEAICNIPLVANLFLEPGAGIFYDKFIYDDMVVEDADSDGNSTIYSDPRFYKLGLRVPINIGYRLDFRSPISLAIFTGPELNWAFAGGITYPKDLKDPTLTDDIDVFKFQRRVAVNWNFGASVEFDYRWMIALGYSLGMNNLYKLGEGTYHESRATLTLGLNF